MSSDIQFKSVRIVDYINDKIYERTMSESFDEQILELIAHIKGNRSVRDYKTKSTKTEVISSIISSITNLTKENFETMSNIIAKRLLRAESAVQEKVSKMNVNVRRGSLLQVLLLDDNLNYQYLLAKVEHSDFVDDNDFSLKTGFSKDKKTIWKSCLFDINDIDEPVFYAKIYSDTQAKFWSKDFLELETINTNESNTKKAFDHIDGCLKRSMKKLSVTDYTYLRNATILYFRTHSHFDYNEMLEEVYNHYSPEIITQEAYATFLEKISLVPEGKFDMQFEPFLPVLNAKIKKIYKVAPSIDIVIKEGIENFKQTIYSTESETGERYITILTNDEETYQAFKR